MEIDFRPSKPDARLRILQIIASVFLSFHFKNQWAVLAFFLAVDCVLLFEYGRKIFLKRLLTYILLNLLVYALAAADMPIISGIFPSFVTMIIRVFPAYLLLKLMKDKTPMDELLCSLEAMHIPKSLSIPLMVVYRYVPTIFQELKYIHESLKMRGLNLSLSNAAHLLKTLENYIVPLLSRSEKISEELAAASLCKGLSTTRRRSCYVDVKLGASDLLYLLGMAAVICGLLYLDFLNF